MLMAWGGSHIDLMYGGEFSVPRIRRDKFDVLLLLCNSLRKPLHARDYVVHTGKATHACGPSYEKIQRYNNSPPYLMARWQPQWIPPSNSVELGQNTFF